MLKKYRAVLLGVLFFAVAMAFLFLIAPPIQIKFRLLGVGITELILLAIALTGGVIYKIAGKKTLKEIFPFSFKSLSFKIFLNSLLVYIGAYCIVLGVNIMQMYIFPGAAETNTALGNFFAEGGVIIMIIALTVMPGICEEMLHRGFILSTFKNIESTAVKLLLMGIIFGIFHADIYRFAPTMVMGMGLTYIMIKTGNLFYSMFFHFINNFIGIAPILILKMTNSGDLTFDIPAGMYSLSSISGILSFTASAMLYLPLGLLFVYLGVRRFSRKDSDAEQKPKRFKFIVPACIVLAVSGFMLSGVSGISGSLEKPVYDANIGVNLTEPFNSSNNFEIKSERNYNIKVYVDGGENVSGSIRITDKNGKEIYNSGQGSMFNSDKTLLLSAGIYTCEIELIPKREIVNESEAIPAKIGVTIS